MSKAVLETAELAKKIVKGGDGKTFDATTYLTTSLGQFLDKSLQYLQALYSAPATGTFRRKKFAKQKVFRDCLLRIFTLPLTQVKIEDLPRLIPVLEFFLHSDTDHEIRNSLISPFLNWIGVGTRDFLKAVSPIFPFIIPWAKCARNEAETKAVMQGFLGNSHAIQSKKPSPCTRQHALDLIQEILARITDEWRGHEDFAAILLLQGILYPVFRERASRLQLTSAATGFSQPIIPEFVSAVFGFFRNMHESGLSILPLAQAPAEIRFLFWVTKQAARSENAVDVEWALFALTRILTTPEVLASPLVSNPEFFLKTLDILGKVVPAKSPVKTKESANTLMMIVYKLLFERLPITKLTEFFNARRFQVFPEAMLLSGLFHHIMLSRGAGSEIAKLLEVRLTRSRMAPAVAYRYGQYLAVLHFAHLLKYRVDEMGGQIAERLAFAERTGERNTFDWILTNFKAIRSSAREFVGALPLDWPPIKDVEPTMQAVVLPELVLPTPERLEGAVSFFLQTFTAQTDCELVPIRQSAFGAILGYYDLITRLMLVPTEVKAEFDRAFADVFRAMVNQLHGQASPLIEEYAYRTVTTLLTDRTQVIRPSEADCSRVLLATSHLLLRQAESVSDLAFSAAQRLIEIGVAGSTMLVPFMLGVVEKRAAFTPAHVRFLASLALFSAEHSIPLFLVNAVSKAIASDPPSFLSAATEIVNSLRANADLRDRLFSLAATIHLKASGEPERWPVVLPLFVAILVESAFAEHPNRRAAVGALEALSESVQQALTDGLLDIELLLPYFPRLARICGQELVTLTDGLAALAIAADIARNPAWVVRLYRVTVAILVTHAEIARQCTSIAKLIESITVRLSSGSASTPVGALQALNLLQTYLAINLLRYPFPDGASYPSNIAETAMKGKSTHVFQIQDDVLVCIREDPGEKVEIDVQTVAGHFRWTASDVAAACLEAPSVRPVEFDDLTVADPEFAPIECRPQQSAFGKRLRGIFDEYPETELDAVGDAAAGVQAVIDDIAKGDQIPLGAAQGIRPVKPRTTALAAFAALGISDPANSPEFTLAQMGSPDDMRAKFSALTAQTVRLKSAASVLYLTDLASASGVRISKLRLEDTSPHYREFLSGLGWTVDLRSHRGFAGGLDSRASRASVYYSDALHEVMFHVAGMIGDQSELIAGDAVHVVWCEGNFDFSAYGTLVKDGTAFVVVQPLPIGLFSVKIVTTKGVAARPGFVEGVVLAKRALPVFVRQTVIGLRIAEIDATKPFQFPLVSVGTELHGMISAHAPQANMTLHERQMAFLE